MLDAEAWVPRARAGDREAVNRLVEIYQHAVYNLCYRMLGDAGEAEDVAQETFMRMYTRLNSYDSARPFKTWLLSIAAHACIDRLRQRRLTWLSLDEPLPVGDLPATHDPALGPEAAMVQREQERQIQGMLARLNPDERSALVLHYWYDLSYEEIAEAAKSTVSAVKSRLFRARRELARALSQEVLV